MKRSSLKALYIFLTSWLGIILLLLLHRSLFVIYELLSLFFPEVGLFGLDRFTLQVLDFVSMLFAMFIGGWYGIWLGLHWFEIVYEQTGHKHKLFHGFIPHHWRDSKSKKNSVDHSENGSANSGVKKPPQRIIMQSTNRLAHVDSFKTFHKKATKVASSWGFDDLAGAIPEIKHKTEPAKEKSKKKVVKKKTSKKTVVKKRVVKKTSKEE